MADTTAETRRVVTDLYRAGIAGDVATFFGHLDPDLELVEPPYLPYGGTYRGLDDFQKVFAIVAGTLDFTTLDVQNIVADGDQAVVRLTARLQGSRAEIRLSEHWTVHDGKVARCEVFFFDPTPLLDALRVSAEVN